MFAPIGSLTNKTTPVTALDIPLGCNVSMSLIPRSSYRIGNEARRQWVERLSKGSFPGLPTGLGMRPDISGWRLNKVSGMRPDVTKQRLW